MLSEANGIARSFNLTNSLVGSPLEPILDDSGVVPPNYPATHHAFTTLTGKSRLQPSHSRSSTSFDDKPRILAAAQIDGLLGAYGIPLGVAGTRRRRLGMHLGVRF